VGARGVSDSAVEDLVREEATEAGEEDHRPRHLPLGREASQAPLHGARLLGDDDRRTERLTGPQGEAHRQRARRKPGGSPQERTSAQRCRAAALVGPRRDGVRGRQPDSGLAPRASITPWREIRRGKRRLVARHEGQASGTALTTGEHDSGGGRWRATSATGDLAIPEARRYIRRSNFPTLSGVQNGSMIEVANLSKRYGELAAVRDASFTAPAGQILGFLGPNGAGKTTTMRIITGFLPATSGTVR